jgi:hypothetical protein
MNKIYKFEEYSRYEEMTEYLLNNFDKLINESTTEEYKSVSKKVLSDLNINLEFIATFGAGIKAFFPIVEQLLFNQGSIEITKESIVLSTICAIGIIYLEEKKFKNAEEEAQLTSDSKSMLEELKLMGIGNGIVKKIIKAFKSIGGIFSKISKHLGKVSLGIIDMFSYTALLIPVMNGIDAIINKYDLNLDTIVQNLMGVGIGLMTIVTKHIFIEIFKRLKNKLSRDKQQEIIDDLDLSEDPIIKKNEPLGIIKTELIKDNKG